MLTCESWRIATLVNPMRKRWLLDAGTAENFQLQEQATPRYFIVSLFYQGFSRRAFSPTL